MTMRIYSLTNSPAAVLENEYYLRTCPGDLEPVLLHGEAGGAYAWGSEAFLRLLHAKMDAIVETTRKHQGETIVWSDVDIQFFGPCSRRILECMEGMDILFQSEFWPPNGKVNMGFIAIKCGPAALAFFEALRLQDLSRPPVYDQSAAQALLDRNAVHGLRWGVLPNEFWAYSHGGVPPPGVLLHHANVEGILEKKIEQLKAVREYVLARRKYRFLRALLDRAHRSRAAGFLARCIPLRLRDALRLASHHDDQLRYRPSYKDWGK